MPESCSKRYCVIFFSDNRAIILFATASFTVTTHLLIFSSQQIVCRYVEKVCQTNDIGCLGFVDATLPIVNSLLTNADFLSKHTL